MVISKSFPVLRLAIVFLSVKMIGAGTVLSCPTEAIVELTDVKNNNSSSFLKKDGVVYPPSLTWSTDGRTFGCPCNFKTCVQLCCDSKEARIAGRCVNDDGISGILPQITNSMDVQEQGYHFFTNDPCTIGWMASSIMKNFNVSKNGSIFAEGTSSHFGQYCLMREPKSKEYLAKVCRPWVQHNVYGICCLVVGILLMLAIFVAYTIAPERRNFHGLIFRSYIATYIMIYVFALDVMFTTELRINPFWYSFADTTMRYFGISLAFWLNIMSFNIWQTFRCLRPHVFDSKERDRKKFICYAIYAWFGPIVVVAITAACMIHVPYFCTDTIGEALKQWGSVAIITISLIPNIFLCGSTAFNINKHKRDTADLVCGLNKHYDVNRQWFNSYLKLFVIMGAHIVVWPFFLVWPSHKMIHFMGTMEVFQCILILVIFVGKDRVKRSFEGRFGARRTRSSIPSTLTVTQI